MQGGRAGEEGINGFSGPLLNNTNQAVAMLNRARRRVKKMGRNP